MKYERLTRRDGNVVKHIEPIKSSHLANRIEEEVRKEFELIHRLAELEDKIESGELCNREEIRKETAKEILDKVYGAFTLAMLYSKDYPNSDFDLVEKDDIESNFIFYLGELCGEYKIDFIENVQKVGDLELSEYRKFIEKTETMAEKLKLFVRKETAREIFQHLYDVTQNHYGGRIILTSNEIKECAAAYGVEVEK